MWIKLQNVMQKVVVDLRIELAKQPNDMGLVGVVNIVDQLARESIDYRTMFPGEFLALVKAINDLKDHAVCLLWSGDDDLACPLFKAIDELNVACEDCADYWNLCLTI